MDCHFLHAFASLLFVVAFALGLYYDHLINTRNRLYKRHGIEFVSCVAHNSGHKYCTSILLQYIRLYSLLPLLQSHSHERVSKKRINKKSMTDLITGFTWVHLHE